MMDWRSLPSELLLNIFSNLPAESVCQSCQWYTAGCDDALWAPFSQEFFGHNANLTLGSFSKLSKSWPFVLKKWKDWFDFRRMFRREVAGSVSIEVVEYEFNGKQKKASNSFGIFSCDSQPLQKGVKDLVFHFCNYNTVIEGMFYRRFRHFKKVYMGRATFPLFAMRHDMETLWLNLDVQPLEGETQEELQIQSVRVCLKLKLRPVQYTVNDFELVATISRGSSYAFGSELLYVQDRDTKKPYFMKIIMDSGPTNNDIPPPTDTQVDNYTYMDDENASPSDKRKSLQSPRVPGASGYALGSSTIHIPPNPFIVDMFTSFRRGLSHYLLMEWVEGGELFSVTRRTLDGRFHEKTVRFYGAQLLLALSHLHANGIVYRDLKPENLLLDRKGNLKLTRRTPRHEFDNGRSFRYNEYLAPEILAGGPPLPHALDTKCDWWSYGAILYQMLVGLPPFSHPSVNATNMKIMVADFSFPKSQNNSSAISEDAQDLVYSLLRKSVKKRLDGKQMRRHPFFASVDWSALERKEIKPPTRPIRRTLGPKDDSTSESSSVVSATTTYDSTSRSFVEVES